MLGSHLYFIRILESLIRLESFVNFFHMSSCLTSFKTVGLEKTFKSSLDIKETKSVNPKGSHPGIFIGRTDAEAEAPILWPPEAKS